MMKSKRLLLFFLLTAVAMPTWSGELYTPQTVLESDNEQLVAKAKFDDPEAGDLYLATILGGKLWFLIQGPSLTESIVPFIANDTFQGEYPLFSIEAGVLPAGNYPLYQVVTQPNSDPLNSDNWVGGSEGLNLLNFSLGLPKARHGDFNGDGFANDDRNRDGFADDDRNQDSFHDDDLDQDGFHDDDLDQDGLHDNPTPSDSSVKVLAFNDLGMRCMDQDYSVLSIWPPSNVVNVQVVKRSDNDGLPQLFDDTQVEVRYSAVQDRSGSINSNSADKTNFWQHAVGLFGVELQPGESLTGLYMPADNPQTPGEQPLHYNTQLNWFSADGIPITPIDDAGYINPYSMLRISAYNKNNDEFLGATDVVVAASKVQCQGCHVTGKMAANTPDLTWATDNNREVQAKKNILMLHDQQQNTDLQNSTPVLCTSCHYSPAADVQKIGIQDVQKFVSTISQALHKFHGELRDEEGNHIIPTGPEVPVEQSCYNCHPGKDTQCHRGAMKTSGFECTACHGDLLAVGGKFPLPAGSSLDGQNDGNSPRRPGIDLPRCQSCHTGDAVSHLTGEDLVFFKDGIRLAQAYKTGDESASPILALNQRFAENRRTLFRNSKGHGGIACEGCHGSTHAIWPNSDANSNDNLTALQLQGHSGPIIECDTCHAPGSIPITSETFNQGPHGLHPVNDSRWTEEHGSFYLRNKTQCKACHGQNLEGTPLAKMAITRTLALDDDDDDDDENNVVTLIKGQPVSCDLCHEKP